MSGRFLVDTNVLVYAYDADIDRRQKALEVIGRASRHDGALPAQVLAEFASVALRKIALDPKAVAKRVAELTASFTVLPLTELVVTEALRGVQVHQFAYYDAQIWAAARLAQIPFVLSEDLSTGTEIEGVSFLNPFKETLDIATL